MQINALADEYKIVAAGLSSDSNKYEFVQLENSVSGKRNINFHHNYPILIKKALSFFIKVYLKLVSTKTISYSEFEFNQLKNISADLIIFHHLHDAALAAELAKYNKVKLIFNAHEYYPLEFDDNRDWMNQNHKLLVNTLKKYSNKIDLCFCVGQIIAQKYYDNFKLNCVVINNSKPLKNLNPVQVNSNKVKLVHHGAALRSRKIELMIDVMNYLSNDYSLDIILVGSDINYLNDIKQLAEKKSNINIVDAVPTEVIPEFLNNYDIGIYILPPTNFNNEFALPNKFFEFIQARLALAISPSPEMKSILSKFDLGVVADDFSAKSLADKIKQITPEQIMYYKNQSHKYAQELSIENNYTLIQQAVAKLVKQ